MMFSTYVQTEEELWLGHLESGMNGGGGEDVKTSNTQKVQLAYSWHNFEEGPRNISRHELYKSIEERKSDLISIKRRMSNNQGPAIFSPPKPMATSHRLWPEIEAVVKQQMDAAVLDSDEWKPFVKDHDLHIFFKSQTDVGRTVNPIKAVQVVQGFTGHEVCHYFFSPQYRYEWETTLEKMTVLETISADTLIFHQTHKRMWPITPRDAVFWSHIREFPNRENLNQPSVWVVVNSSTEHAERPANADKRIRLSMKVCLLCQTEVNHPKDGTRVSRDDITCKITYCALIDPSGWAPSAVFRAVSKREYPKFLRKFIAYVKAQTKDEPIMF